jgi:hypothetical protein
LTGSSDARVVLCTSICVVAISIRQATGQDARISIFIADLARGARKYACLAFTRRAGLPSVAKNAVVAVVNSYPAYSADTNLSPVADIAVVAVSV